MTENEIDMLDIPPFLRRNPDNTLPDVSPPVTAAVTPRAARSETGFEVRQEGCQDAAKHQTELHAAQAERKKEKSYTRLAKMKDRQALKEGKTWDPTTAKWV